MLSALKNTSIQGKKGIKGSEGSEGPYGYKVSLKTSDSSAKHFLIFLLLGKCRVTRSRRFYWTKGADCKSIMIL